MEETERPVSRLLTVKEVAKVTGLKEWRIQSLLRTGKGPPHVRFDRYYRVSEDSLARWLEEQEK